MVKGIHHINLRPYKDDYDKMLEFYCDVLGMKIYRSWTKQRGDFLSRNCYIEMEDGSLIEACETDVENRNPGIIQHLALASDDALKTVEMLKEKGYQVVNSKGQPSDTLTIDVGVGDPEVRCRTGFVLSPTGELVEFVQDLD